MQSNIQVRSTPSINKFILEVYILLLVISKHFIGGTEIQIERSKKLKLIRKIIIRNQKFTPIFYKINIVYIIYNN